MLDYRTETFLTVCKTLNFTTAAKQLNITQPAVSQHSKRQIGHILKDPI